MWTDGIADYYRVQHRDSTGLWCDTDIGHILFRDMTYTQKRSPLAECFREVLAKEGASTDLWQRYGLYGFEHREDAQVALGYCRAHAGSMVFRLVRRIMTRQQEVIA